MYACTFSSILFYVFALVGKRNYSNKYFCDINIVMNNQSILQKLNINTCKVLGVDIAVSNMDEVSRLFFDYMDQLRGEYVCISNVHTTVMAYEDEQYRRVQNEAFMAVPDGKPLVLACKKKGFKNAGRIAGPDLMPEILKMSQEKGYTHYFYGSTKETLSLLGERLLKNYPGLKIAGMYAPPFRPLTEEEDEAIISRINEANPDFIWVGLGAPKQENWMNVHRGKVNGIMFGVGAAFDFHAGTLKRAPRWMQEWCLEWLYRLCQDPKRLFKRYLKTNTKFIWLTLFKGK